ncbi:hypothetical protein G7046_g1028 [Stylonectria norvegica]|nr:hypothetical protein G7046_g1028 [Stylonectria norvegica]
MREQGLLVGTHDDDDSRHHVTIESDKFDKIGWDILVKMTQQTRARFLRQSFKLDLDLTRASSGRLSSGQGGIQRPTPTANVEQSKDRESEEGKESTAQRSTSGASTLLGGMAGINAQVLFTDYTYMDPILLQGFFHGRDR